MPSDRGPHERARHGHHGGSGEGSEAPGAEAAGHSLEDHAGDSRADRAAHQPVPGQAGSLPRLGRKAYESELGRLQIELVKMQEWVRGQGWKVVVVFEGRDAAGKGGVIKRIMEPLNPRYARVVALPAPSERERTQWYFQRYVAHLPAAGEMALFDRSWYNRAGVERVMGFCTEDEYREFLRSCPEFERMLIRSGITLVKYWFSVSDEEQERRFQDRIEDPTKRWEPDGPGITGALGRVLEGEGRDVRVDGHSAVSLVGGPVRRQATRQAQLHPPPALGGPVHGPDARGDRAAPTPARRRVRPSAHDRPDLRAAGVLTPPRAY
jgi:polyphosphate kinase 2